MKTDELKPQIFEIQTTDRHAIAHFTGQKFEEILEGTILVLGPAVKKQDYDALASELSQLHGQRDRLVRSLQEFIDELEEDRCPDPNCGGECAIRKRADAALSNSSQPSQETK